MAYSLDTKIVLPLGLSILLITYWLYYMHNRNRSREYELIKQKRIRLIFCFYLLVMTCFTLLPILIPPIEPQPIEYNLNISYLFTILYDRAHLISIAGNALLFAPLVVIGRLSEFRCFATLMSSAITSLFVSLVIEVLQGLEMYFGMIDPATICVVDINDIITNTIGGIIGWLLIELYYKDREVN